MSNLVIDGDFREAVALGLSSANTFSGEGVVSLFSGSPWALNPGQNLASIFTRAQARTVSADNAPVVLPDPSLENALLFVGDADRVTAEGGVFNTATMARASVPAGARLTSSSHIQIAFWVLTTGRTLGLKVGRTYGTGGSAADTVYREVFDAVPGRWTRVVREIPCTSIAAKTVGLGDTLTIEVYFDAATSGAVSTIPGGFATQVLLCETTATAAFAVGITGLECAILNRETPAFEYVSSTSVSQVVPQKVYRALLTQSSTAAPTVEILENTLGALVWSRSGAGDYIGTLVGAFPAAKAMVLCGTGNTTSGGAVHPAYAKITPGNADQVRVKTDGTDGELARTPIEIRVYA